MTGPTHRPLSPSLIIFLWQIASISKSKDMDIFKALDMYCEVAFMESWPELHSLQWVWTHPQMGFWGLHLPASALSPRFSCLSFLFLSPSENNKKSLLSEIFVYLSSVVKNPPANARDSREVGSIPGLGRSSREGNGNPLKYSCLENSVARGTQQVGYSPWGPKESDTTLSNWAHKHGKISVYLTLVPLSSIHSKLWI